MSKLYLYIPDTIVKDQCPPKYILLSNPALEDARINRISKNHFIFKKKKKREKNHSFHIILFLLDHFVCVRSDYIKWIPSLDKSLCPTGCTFAYLVLRKSIKQLIQNYSKHLDPSKHRVPNDYRTSPEKVDQLCFRIFRFQSIHLYFR